MERLGADRAPGDLHVTGLPDVSSLGTVLTVWAHPDDEAYLTGGLMPAAVVHGQRVACVTATHATGPRAAELAAALEVLGVTERIQLGYEDGGCDPSDPRAITDMVGVLESVRPETVVTFGPDGFTGHLDHRAVSRWVTEAVALTDVSMPRVLHPVMTHAKEAEFRDVHTEFTVFDDGLPRTVGESELSLSLRMQGSALERKVAALEAHGSQTRGLIDAMGRERFSAWVETEYFVTAGGQPPS